ncbi:DUF2812 domain-containing protein [Pseudoflavonifractor sp. 60]|uniref:DUF2812 domain-containing protein n=1 Tax=Pseudoflavonifractor sp. 60 TaxID=2304576 RepID=UPI00136D4E17|nr:DUF2812 domain-containing protein [Pseudoflavonifractor sp. 60]NBI66186.1 DUF2812 domain-containing protein [Pseudoflavonifractor sp. 60]
MFWKYWITTPVSLYDIPGLEHWLEEQANAGLFPIQVTGDFTRFRRDEHAPGTRFRLEVSNGRELAEPERLELYCQSGWEYAGRVGKVYFLFYTADPRAPELHTDPVTRGISLEWLTGRVQRARKKQRILHFLILGLFILAGVLLWRMDPRRIPLFLFDLTGTPLIFLLLGFLFWRDEERDCHLLLDLQRSLELGVTPKTRPRPRWSLHAIPFWITIPLAGLAVVLWTGQLFGLYDLPPNAPLEHFSRPYIHLQDLESEPLVTYKELFGEPPRKHSGSSWGQNIVTRKFSFLSPSYYTVEQSLLSPVDLESKQGYSPSGEPEYVYSPDLEAVYFHLLVPPLARTIAMSQLAQLELMNLRWSYEELSHPELDFVVVARAENHPEWQMAAAGRDGHVVALLYGGRENLTDHLDMLAAALK